LKDVAAARETLEGAAEERRAHARALELLRAERDGAKQNLAAAVRANEDAAKEAAFTADEHERARRRDAALLDTAVREANAAREQVKAALREAEVARTHVDVKLSALNAAHAEQLAAANTEAARWRECAENADKKAASIFIPGGIREGLSGNGSSRAAGGTPLLRRAGSGLVVGIGEDEDEEGMEKGLREGTEDGLRRSAVNRDDGEDGWIVRAPPRAREGATPASTPAPSPRT
jgi:hypothetical protein